MPKRNKAVVPNKILNPETGRWIQVGGATYRRLMDPSSEGRRNQDQELRTLRKDRKELVEWLKENYPDLTPSGQDELLLSISLLGPHNQNFVVPVDGLSSFSKPLFLPNTPNRAVFNSL